VSDVETPDNVIDPDALCAYPDCGRPLDDHTFREFREHNPALLLPYEPVGGEPIEEPGPDGVIATGIFVKAMVVSLDKPPQGMRRHHPALGFTFYGVDGKTEIGRYTLVADSTSLRSLRQIMASAIDGALKSARRRS
jgi:hypothetical protein